jgi:hypothetical protein
VVDPGEHRNLDGLRRELLDIIDERLDSSELSHWLRAEQPFEFSRSQLVIFATGKTLARPHELAAILPHVATGTSSIILSMPAGAWPMAPTISVPGWPASGRVTTHFANSWPPSILSSPASASCGMNWPDFAANTVKEVNPDARNACRVRRGGRPGCHHPPAAAGPPLKGMKVVHVNSTRVGGGVAEIPRKAGAPEQ